MSRFRRTLALSLLLTTLALPASAVASSRTNGNGQPSFLSAFWNALTVLFSTDGRCGLDPDGQCFPG